MVYVSLVLFCVIAEIRRLRLFVTVHCIHIFKLTRYLQGEAGGGYAIFFYLLYLQ